MSRRGHHRNTLAIADGFLSALGKRNPLAIRRPDGMLSVAIEGSELPESTAVPIGNEDCIKAWRRAALIAFKDNPDAVG
jgi:hypothetical protein